MIRTSDLKELRSKATKGSLADTAELAAARLERLQFLLMLAIVPIIVIEFFLGKAGWFVLPAVAVIAGAYARLGTSITLLRGRSASYKPLKVKTTYPRRDSVR